MAISVFDLFKIGIGPSSSHTVGPMRAAHTFATRLADRRAAHPVPRRVRAELFGSLGATGHGHGTDKAVVLGLEGERPDHVDPRRPRSRAWPRCATTELLRLGGDARRSPSSIDDDLVLHRRKRLPFHSNGMRFTARRTPTAQVLLTREYYSVGGGFVLDEDEIGSRARRRRPDAPGAVPVQHRRRAAARMPGDRAADQRR